MAIKLIKAYPAISFLKSSLSVNKKHCSNEKEIMRLSYVNKERQKINPSDQAARVIFDVFRDQITDGVLKLFKQNHIDTVFVPPNMTDILQRLDLTVNSFPKKFSKKKHSVTGIWNRSSSNWMIVNQSRKLTSNCS